MEATEMHTTLKIDEDVIAFARSQAQREHMTVGEVIFRLAREGIAKYRPSAIELAQKQICPAACA